MSAEVDIERFVVNLTRAQNDKEIFAVVERESKRRYDHVLFTCLRFDYSQGVMSRLHSSREDVSPTGGAKPLPRGPWADRLVEQGRAYIGRSRKDLKKVFFDYEMLWGIGCESVINVPVRWKNSTVGTINILGRAEQFEQRHAAQLSLYAQLVVPLFLPHEERTQPAATISS